MATANLATLPLPIDANMALASGALLKIYTAGTTAPVTTYSNAGQTTAHAWPIVETGGRFPAVYIPSGEYKWRLEKSDGSLIEEKDNVSVGDSTGIPGVVTLSSFGATGDGTTDDTTAVTNAFNHASTSGATVYGTPGAVYNINSSVDLTGKNVRFDGQGCEFRFSSSGFKLRFTNTVTEVALSADYTLASTSITTGNTGLTVADGQPILMVSNAIAPDNRDKGSNASQYRMGEWVTGVSAASGVITIKQPPSRAYGITTTDSGDASDEARVPAFTTALSARVFIPDRAPVFEFRNCTFYYDDGHGQGSGDIWVGKGLVVVGYVGPVIENVHCTRAYDAAIALRGTHGAVIHKCNARDLENNTPDSQQGYGLSDSGYGTRVTECTWTNTRHGHTTNASSWETTEDDLGILMSTGGGVNWTVRDCHAIGNADNSGFSPHHGAANGTYADCTARDCGSNGFSIRGRNIKVIDPVVINCQSGIFVHTEYDSGDTNDDFYVSGELIGDFTSCKVTGGTFDVMEEVFLVGAATLAVDGWIKASSGCQKLVGQDSDAAVGLIYWNGSGTFTVTNNEGARSYVAHNGDGVFDLKQGVAKAQDPFPTTDLIIERGVDLTVDTRNQTGTNPYLFTATSGCTIVNRGRIHATLPATGRVMDSNADSATGDGEIIIALDGASDDATNHNLSGYDLTVYSNDGTVEFYGPAKGSRAPTIYSKRDFGGSHTGNTSQTNLIAGTAANQANWVNRYGAVGDVLSYRAKGRKSGTAGTATLTVQYEDNAGATQTLYTATLPTNAGVWETELGYWVTAANTVQWQAKTYLTDGTTDFADSGTLSSFDMTDTDTQFMFKLTVTLANAGDTVTADVLEISGNQGGGIY